MNYLVSCVGGRITRHGGDSHAILGGDEWRRFASVCFVLEPIHRPMHAFIRLSIHPSRALSVFLPSHAFPCSVPAKRDRFIVIVTDYYCLLGGSVI